MQLIPDFAFNISRAWGRAIERCVTASIAGRSATLETHHWVIVGTIVESLNEP
jgi:hypothetical protein